MIINGQYAAIHKALDLVEVLGGNMDIIAARFELNAEFAEGIGYNAEVLESNVFDCDFALRHRR